MESKKRRNGKPTRYEVSKDELSKMDANRLITEVQKRPALWNQRHASYHNREYTNRVWTEIASTFKLPKPLLKAKWKGLRDTFRAELKKELLHNKSKMKKPRPIWIHYKSLLFLKDQMLPRPPIWDSHYNENNFDGFQQVSQTNETPTDNYDSLTDHLLRVSLARARENISQDGLIPNELLEDQFGNLEYHSTSDGETMLQSLSPEQVLGVSSSGRDSMTGVNGGWDSDSVGSAGIVVEPLNSQHCDDNYYFLMSLLPHMNQLSAERRMFLRMKIQELVYEEVYKKNSLSTPCSTTSS